jgi:hypothetical protein
MSKTIVVMLSETASELKEDLMNQVRFTYLEARKEVRAQLDAVYADKNNFVVRKEVKNNG